MFGVKKKEKTNVKLRPFVRKLQIRASEKLADRIASFDAKIIKSETTFKRKNFVKFRNFCLFTDPTKFWQQPGNGSWSHNTGA